MNSSRLPTLTALFLALLLGAAPWRVCAHGGHGRVWVPGAHSHAACDDATSEASACRHARSGHAAGMTVTRKARACSHIHGQHTHAACAHRCAPTHASSNAPALPAPHDTTCHCDDQPLVLRLLSLPVQVQAPSLSGWAHLATLTTVSAGAAEVARCGLAGCRIAHEEDPIVLLR